MFHVSTLDGGFMALRIVACLLFALAVGGSRSAWLPAQEPPPAGWQTGEQLETQLQLASGFTWGEMPLRQGLDNLSRSNRVAIWLDRRVDPDQKVDIQITEMPLLAALEKLAQKLDLAAARVGPVVYLGPPRIEKLGTLAAMKRQESETLPAATRRRMAELSPTDWEELAQPRQLIEQTATRCGLRSFYLEQVPHDLWPARQLPAMHGAELLTLLLAGFDMSFEYAPDGSAIRPIAMPERIVLVRDYAYTGDLGMAAEKIREFFPAAKVTLGPRKLKVAGSQEEHREIARFLSGQPMRRTVTLPGTKLYSLEVQGQPVGAIVRALAQQLGREARFDPALTEEDLNRPISFAVKEKTLPELLQAALKPAGLAYELTSKEISISKSR
jgi:hypothetical protein